MAAGLVSVAGTWMQQAAQAWLVLERTDSGTAVGLTVAVQALPALTIGMWGGVLADRHDRRRIMLATQSLSMLLAACLALLVAVDQASVGVIPVFALLSGVVGVIDAPAAAAYGSTLLPAEDLANGLALGSTVASAGRVVGLAAAGVVVAAVGPAMAFGVNALSFLAPVLVMYLAPPAIPAHPSMVRRRATAELREGIGHVWRNDEARITIGAAWALSCFGRNFQVTMALMAAHAFGAGADLYGRFSTLFALGAVTGSVLAARLPQMTRRVLVYAALVAGGAQVLSGLAGNDVLAEGRADLFHGLLVHLGQTGFLAARRDHLLLEDFAGTVVGAGDGDVDLL